MLRGRPLLPVAPHRRRPHVGDWHAGRHRHVLTAAKQVAALQGVQQGKGRTDEHHGDDENDDDRDHRGFWCAGVAQRQARARQDHRVLGNAPAPDDGSDAKRGDAPDAPGPADGKQGEDH